MLLCINCILLATIRDYPIIIIFSAIGITANLLLIASALRWAISPVNLLNIGIIIVDQIRQSFEQQKKSEREQNITEGWLSTVNTVWTYTDNVLQKVHSNTPSTIASMFLVLSLFLLTITVASFSFIYYGIKHADSSSFPGLGGSIGECLLYSFSVITTSPIGTVQTADPVQQTIYCFELLCTILLLTLFLSMFSVGLTLQEQTIAAFRGKIEEFRQWAESGIGVYIAVAKQQMQAAANASKSADTGNNQTSTALAVADSSSNPQQPNPIPSSVSDKERSAGSDDSTRTTGRSRRKSKKDDA
jgi:hypothetical protein